MRLAMPWEMKVMHSPAAIMGHTSIAMYRLNASNCPRVISPAMVRYPPYSRVSRPLTPMIMSSRGI